MKIMSQSADELVLKEGNASGMAIGGGLIVAGMRPVRWAFGLPWRWSPPESA